MDALDDVALLQIAVLQQSQQNRYMHIAVLLRLLKMLDSAAFYTLSGNSPGIFLMHF